MQESKYIPNEDLVAATKVAELLNRPLLLAGEPGTGKTTYAKHIADTEGKDLFIFNTKSVSLAQDLFYTYDAVAHFANRDKSAIEFITLEGLGKAIVNAFGVEDVKKALLNEENTNYQLRLLRQSENRDQIIETFLKNCRGNNSIVLIDEVDKAPRDFPNDILNEIENYEFFIKELGLHFSLDKSVKSQKDKVLVLLTSNFDKNLPDAFLRRCLFYEIEFPDKTALTKIIVKHIPDIDENLISGHLDEFDIIRNTDGITKPPSTSELIDCLKWLFHKNELNSDLKSNKAALATLLKKKEDAKLIYKKLPSAQ